jgi:hypothetical protein
VNPSSRRRRSRLARSGERAEIGGGARAKCDSLWLAFLRRSVWPKTGSLHSEAVVRILQLLLASFVVALLACSDPPPPQIPLARLTNEGCTAYPAQPIDRTCLPRLAAENVALAFEVEERCGTCSSSVEKCSVTVDGKDLTFSLDGQSCHQPGPCPEVCSKRRAFCRLPALPAGRYNVRYADAEGRVEHLEVGAGGARECKLDHEG